MFGLLSIYREREGHLDVSTSHKESDENLGRWLAYQKKIYKEGTLSDYNREQLEDLGVELGNNVTQTKFDANWETMFSCLRDYRKANGDCFVSQGYVTPKGGKALGEWLDRQRRVMDRGELLPSRKSKLEALGVVFGDVASQKWEDMYQRLSDYRQHNGHIRVPYSYQDKDGKNLGTWVNTQRQSKKKGTLLSYQESKLEALGMQWEVTNSQWDSMFSLLVRFKDEKGHCNVPWSVKVDSEDGGTEMALGQWVARQRRSKQKGSLSVAKRTKLENLGLAWNRNDQWDELFECLVEYQKQHGDCNVPRDYRIGAKHLGTWLVHQRQSKRKGDLDPLRQARLEDLGIEWNRRPSWDEFYDLLVQYHAREGNCNVPQTYKENDRNLGAWLSQMRCLKKKNALEKEQIQALESIGVVWDVTASKWDDMVTLLNQYKKKYGHCRVPQSHKEDGRNLGTWLNTQRQRKRAGTLPSNMIEILEAIGVTWNLQQSRWDEMFALLVQYKEREGTCLAPQHIEKGQDLGTWLDQQRMLYRKNTLDATKKEKLEKIGMVWNVNAFKQEEMLIRLLRFKEREGHCDVPSNHLEDGKALGTWLHKQRRVKKTGKLDPDLAARLENIGVVWSVNKRKWETMFALLEDFNQREGHSCVPQDHIEGPDGKRLGNWLDWQRVKKKSDRLDPALQERLEGLGVKWTIYAKFDDDDWGFEGMDHLFDDEDIFG